MARAGGGKRWPEVGGGEYGTPAKDSAHKFDRIAGRTPGAIFVGTVADAHLGVFLLKCSGCGGRIRLIGFITEPATVQQILERVGEPTSASAIALARSPPLEMKIGQRLGAPQAVFGSIPELECD